jgi:hypothetical protein
MLRRLLIALALVAVSARGFDWATRITPPNLPPPRTEEVTRAGASVRVGPAHLSQRGAVSVMQLRGSPEALGYQHARLTTPLMVEGDRRMLDLFSFYVPSPIFRWAITRIVQARYRNLDAGFSTSRRAEIFGETRGYEDPFTYFFPTYQRLVYLHGLYDIALAFEHSPLLGCTAFVASGAATKDGATPGHTIVGRNFDLDVDPWFDEEKIVEIVEPDHAIAFVSVAWAGMTGVVSGMNAAGIWVSVNGGRASAPHPGGVPVVFTTRAVLEQARSLDEALRIIEHDEPMVSHILLVADGKTGESMVVERAPGRPLGVVRDPSSMVLANHFRTSPLKDDPKDARVRDTTSSEARQARMEELLRERRGRIDPAAAIEILRDREEPGGGALPLGNRIAIDGLIATHSVVADLTARVLWVSEGPHTLGRYRRIDLDERLANGDGAAASEAAGDLYEDPALTDGTLARYRLGIRQRKAAAEFVARGDLDRAAAIYQHAISVRGDDHLAWRGLALLEERRGDAGAARAAWQRVLALAPESPAARREAEAHADAR